MTDSPFGNVQKAKPEIDFPGDTPPSELVVEDIEVGTGEEASAGRQWPAPAQDWRDRPGLTASNAARIASAAPQMRRGQSTVPAGTTHWVGWSVTEAMRSKSPS